MLERAELALKVLCVALAAVLAYEAWHLVSRLNPLKGAGVPAVPTLAASTNAPGAVSGKGTNAAPTQAGKPGDTNSATAQKSGAAAANTVVTKTNAVAASTNSPTAQKGAANETNAVSAQKISMMETNSVAAQKTGDTNAAAVTKPETASTNTVQTMPPRSGTNDALVARSGDTPTNSLSIQSSNVSGTNAIAAAKPGGTGTNLAGSQKSSVDTNAATAMAAARRGSSPVGRSGGAGGGRAPELPPEAKKRVDWIVRSETLAPIIRPQPMGLLGIAGNRAFIRAPNGQTDMVKEGDTLGPIKLVRIGTNRVLVEEDGQPKELMIYGGYGGESLLPKPTAKTNETSGPISK